MRDIQASYRYGLHLDTQLYADYMRRFAVHCGAEAGAPLADVIADRQTGRIDAVTMKDGGRLEADLYLDCTGPSAVLLDRLDPGAWREFSGAPPLNRMAWTMTDGDGALSLTDYDSGAGGWRSVTPLQDARCVLAAYNAAQIDDDAARAWLGPAPSDAIAFAPIRRRRRAPWAGNVIAIGEAACELDPHEAPALRIVEAGLTALRGLLPATHDDCGERDEYNRIMANVFERFHDFQMLHYARASASWTADVALSEPLQRKIEQFESRGRLVQYDEESFPPESWIACLIGHGVIPRRCDPLIDPLAEDALKARLAAMRRAVDEAAKAMPDQLDYLKRAGAVKPERAR
jgi:tryptophan halogenase